MANKVKTKSVCLISLSVYILSLCYGCIAPRVPSAIEMVESRLALITISMRIAQSDWRIPSEYSDSILDELLNPIVNDPESLADLCLWIENLSEQNGASDQNHSYFLDSVKWHAISAICKIRSRKAYDEFMRIRKTIGSDGAESMFFKELKEKYFGDRD